jgi:hypothetical protein
MAGTGIFLDHTGLVDYQKINDILEALKGSPEYRSLNKTTGKRLYCVLNECLENIAKHSAKKTSFDIKFQPFIFSRDQNNKIGVKTGNPVFKNQTDKLKKDLDRINQMNDENLVSLYDNIINKEIVPGANGAGLGFIIMKLKSGNSIDYSFTPIDKDFSFFETNILINKYIMRKLIFEKTASSPKVILDPEKNEFEISGESRPPNVGAFYGEILRWVDDYTLNLLKSQGVADSVIFNFDLEYFNSSSAKYILDLCKQFALVRSKGKNIEVRWKYEDDDIDMLEAGKEMSRISKLPFEFVKKEN